MARPLKQGVDYFPMDVHLDNKFKFLEIKFGLEGFAIAVKLLQYIYSNGYWASWDEDSMLIFADEKRIDPDRLYAIVNECINRKIFSQRMYEDHKILTSSGIQKRYKEMVRRRKDVNVIAEYLLIDNIYLVNDANNSVNDDIMITSGQHDDDKSTQRKGNKNKLKDSNKDRRCKPPTLEEVKSYFKERETHVDPDAFYAHYESVNWYRGKTKISNWKSCLTTWEKKHTANSSSTSIVGRAGQAAHHKQRDPELEYRRMEIARNQWIEAGNNPNEFVYRPN